MNRPSIRRFYARDRHPAAFHREFFGKQEYAAQISFLSRSELLGIGRRLGLGPGKTLLDIGCGIGGPAILMATHFGCRVVGVDLAEENILAADLAAREAGVAKATSFVAQDWREFFASPNRPDHFDAAIMIDSLVHFWNRRRLLEDLRNLGHRPPTLALATELVAPQLNAADLEWRERSGHVHCFTEDDIRAELADMGWNIEHFRTIAGRRHAFANFCLTLSEQPGAPALDHLAAIARISEGDYAVEAVIHAQVGDAQDEACR